MKMNLKSAASAAVIAALMGAATVSLATPVLAQVQAPQLTLRSEEAAHPQIVRAIHEMSEALREMERAPHDFGGNKAKAIADTRQAIHSLRKALYYRLKLDDEAIDRAQ
ncbi:MAG: hypothetical protein JO089_07090 [Alphaproteobacteria bacterium]|nr:hypothetical protein [Alphaproteobacteria bacterium]